MARKSKKSSKKGKEVTDNKNELSKLLDSRRENGTNRRVKPIPTEKNEQKTALEETFSSLLGKFKVPFGDEKIYNQELSIQESHQDAPNKERDESSEIEEHNEKPKSKRKLRKLEQPSLSQLKGDSSYPQMVEWYDCNSPNPHLLVSIKASKNVVPVPGHWQMKREYLSGRSLLEKRPFELPDIIKQTGIEQMRKTLPDAGDDNSNPSSKELSRARVQPKLGALDIDYRKLHDVFFKLGANWKPDILLPFGDLYFENRNLYEESQWQSFIKHRKPGRLSKELRDIMKLQEGQLPPWCMKMKSLGMPPGYPTLKVAGLNWGIENLKGDVYGILDSSKKKKKASLFGTILSLDDESEESDENEIEEERIQETAIPETVADPAKIDPFGGQNQEDVAAKFTTTKALHQVDSMPIESDESSPKHLYTVLTERKADEASDHTGSKSIYEMPGAKNQVPINVAKQSVREERSSSNINDDDDQKATETFRF